MNLKFLNKELDQLIGKFQLGGAAPEAAPVEEAPAAPELGGDPMELILQAAALAVQTQDGQLALLVCEALVEMAGGSAPTPEATTLPIYKKGGILVKRIPKD